jgi:hypothetical protein
MSEHGKFGWAPPSARSGDAVAVFYESNTPVILRPLESSQYRLFGECYFEGLMGGEAMDPSIFPEEELFELSE